MTRPNYIARIKMVKAMEYITRQVNDEEVFETWLREGVADGDIDCGDLDVGQNDPEELEYYLTKDALSSLMAVFLSVMNGACKSGGLYCDGVLGEYGRKNAMMVYQYDGTRFACDSLEVSSDGKSLIVDEERTIPLQDVMRVRPCEIDSPADDDV